MCNLHFQTIVITHKSFELTERLKFINNISLLFTVTGGNVVVNLYNRTLFEQIFVKLSTEVSYNEASK